MSRKINIVHVHQKFYPYQGGSTQRLLNQLLSIDKEKYAIYVISEKLEGNEDREVYNGINIIRYKNFYEIPYIIYKLNKFNSIDILHAHNFRPSFYTLLTNIILRKKNIIEMHSMYKTKSFITEFISKKMLKRADRVIVLSNESKIKLYKDHYLNHNQSNVEIIYNGVNLEEFSNVEGRNNFDEELERYFERVEAEKKIIIGYIGSLQAFQGIEELKQIYSKLTNDNISFIIIGGTREESEKLKSQMKNITNNIDLFVRPFVDKEKVKFLYSKLDILLMPRPKLASTDSAIPLKPIEALASNTLVYSTPVKGMIELKNTLETENIILLDIEQMIKKINSICKDDLGLVHEEKNLIKFDISNQINKLIDIYEEMIG